MSVCVLVVELEIKYVDLFLDGSCSKPADPLCRLASWGVVQWIGDGFWPVACGGVPGLRQTSLRGEIFAALAALKFVVDSHLSCRLWIDNMRVYKVLASLLNHEDPPLDHSKDVDLWTQLRDQFRHSHIHISGVFKVQAHAEPDQQIHPLDEWAVRGNQAADACAAGARDTLKPQLLKHWKTLIAELQSIRSFAKDLHAYFVSVGQRALQSTQRPEPLQPKGILQSTVASCDAGILELAQLTLTDLPTKFRHADAEHILRWIATLTDSSTQVVWVTFHQLLVDYQMFSERIGPAFAGKKWYSITDDTAYCYKKQVAWFSRFLQGIGSVTSSPLQIQQCRPSSHVLNFWCGAIQLHFSNDRLQRLDSFYKQFAKVLPARQIARDLATVPPGRWPL